MGNWTTLILNFGATPLWGGCHVRGCVPLLFGLVFDDRAQFPCHIGFLEYLLPGFCAALKNLLNFLE